jgi:hypothetical protein
MLPLKEQLSEVFFERELDEAFEMGIREGVRRTLGTVQMQSQVTRPDLTKTQQVGLDRVLELIIQEKKRYGVNNARSSVV